MGFTVEGFTPKPGDGAGSMVNAVSPGYLEALQAPIVRGRAFTTQDARIPPEVTTAGRTATPSSTRPS